MLILSQLGLNYCWLSFDDCRLKTMDAILIYTYKNNEQNAFYTGIESDETSPFQGIFLEL